MTESALIPKERLGPAPGRKASRPLFQTCTWQKSFASPFFRTCAWQKTLASPFFLAEKIRVPNGIKLRHNFLSDQTVAQYFSGFRH